MEVALEDVQAAARRIDGHVLRTPCIWRSDADLASGCSGLRLHFKAENFQRGGSFKARGALHAVLCHEECRAAARRTREHSTTIVDGDGVVSESAVESNRADVPAVVVAHSSGNHASAVAWAASVVGLEAEVVIPHGAPTCKVEAAVKNGAKVVRCESNMKAREECARQVEENHARAGKPVLFVAPFDDPRVIAGQGTVAVEMLAQVPHLDVIVAPISGGGLLSGIAVAAKAIKPSIRVIGAEPRGTSEHELKTEPGEDGDLGRADAALSLRRGTRTPCEAPNTLADGLRATVGRITWPFLRELVDDVVVVDDAHIVRAMQVCFETLKMVVEPSGATSLAAVMSPQFQDHPLLVGCTDVGVVLSGGNVDLDVLWTDVSARAHPSVRQAASARFSS